MGSSFELLALPAKIVPAAPMSDEEFLAFCELNEPYQFEINEKGEILVMTPSGLEGGNFEGYVFRKLDIGWSKPGRGFAVNSNAGFRLAGHLVAYARCGLDFAGAMEFVNPARNARSSASFVLTSSLRFARRAIVRRPLRRRWASGS